MKLLQLLDQLEFIQNCWFNEIISAECFHSERINQLLGSNYNPTILCVDKRLEDVDSVWVISQKYTHYFTSWVWKATTNMSQANTFHYHIQNTQQLHKCYVVMKISFFFNQTLQWYIVNIMITMFTFLQ